MDENRHSVENADPSARDTFAAICTAAVAAVIFWAAVLSAILLLISIIAGLVLTRFLAPDIATVAFAALCIWLTVRIISRRERWAIRLAIATIAVLVFYLGLAGFAYYLDRYVIGGGP